MTRRIRIPTTLVHILNDTISVPRLVPHGIRILLEEIRVLLLRLVGVQREEAGDEGALEHGALLVEGAGEGLGEDVVGCEFGERAVGDGVGVLGGFVRNCEFLYGGRCKKGVFTSMKPPSEKALASSERPARITPWL